MRKDYGPQRNADGIITKAAQYQSRDIPQARIEPNRKWFTNTRVWAAFPGAIRYHGTPINALRFRLFLKTTSRLSGKLWLRRRQTPTRSSSSPTSCP